MNSQPTLTPSDVTVLGGINLDTLLRVGSLPHPGETVLGSGLFSALGGKAANQAVAVARAGVSVALLGAVGADVEGGRLIRTLSAAGVRTDGLRRLPHTPTGRATVLVDGAGQNVIVVTPGANGTLTAEGVEEFGADITSAKILVVQGEVPLAASAAAVLLATRHGVRTLVNLAPYGKLDAAAVAAADPLIVNEVEASQLLGRDVTGVDSVRVIAELARFSRSAVVTLGADGAVVVDRDRSVHHIPAPAAPDVVDTTGAGDAFVGVLAAALSRDLSLIEAVPVGVKAATESIGVLGAGESYPIFGLGPAAHTSEVIAR